MAKETIGAIHFGDMDFPVYRNDAAIIGSNGLMYRNRRPLEETQPQNKAETVFDASTETDSQLMAEPGEAESRPDLIESANA